MKGYLRGGVVFQRTILRRLLIVRLWDSGENIKTNLQFTHALVF
jgi:hypothetical protein